MATLFSRLFSLGYTLDPEQRKELGNIVKTQFFSTELKQKFYKKVDQQEAGTTFQVLYYDPRFTPRIDQLITFYAELHGIKNTPRKPKKEVPKKIFKPEKPLPKKTQHPSQKPTPQPIISKRKRIPISSGKRPIIIPSKPAYSAKPKSNPNNTTNGNV
jgi:hypothetical protein